MHLGVWEFRRLVPAWVVWLLATGCMGEVTGTAGTRLGEGGEAAAPGPGPGGEGGGPTAGGGGDGQGSPDGHLPALDCSIRQAASSSVRRLTRQEYVNTVRDLLQDPALVVADLPLDGRTHLFTGNAATPLSANAARRYLDLAESLSQAAVPRFSQLVSCTGMADDACAAKFVTELGRRALRRPLTAKEATTYRGLYTASRGQGETHAQALRWVLAALLQSTHFLHHIERGDEARRDGEIVPLTPHELAARLSYFYWKTMPDEALRAAADAGALDTPEGITAQAQRLLAHPRARGVAVDFHAQLLELDRLSDLTKEPTMFPGFDASMRASMRAETEKFIEHVYWDGDGKLPTLLTADFSFVDAKLAPVYGLSGVTSSTPVRTPLPAGQRAGLLTQASFLAVNALADQTSPVFRGKFVRERLLCQELGAPPPGVETQVDPPSPGLSTRERFAEHSKNPACAGCHVAMDPIGFGFENYDAVGAYRTEDNGVPVDASGEIINGGEVSGSFVGAVALAQKLAESRLVKACVAGQWLSYAAQRGHVARDACSTEQLAQRLVDSGGDLRALLLELPLTDSFRYRAPVAAEEVCP